MLGKFYTARAWPSSNLLFAFGCLSCLRGFFVLTLEAFHAARRIDELLFARKKRVAARADLDAHEIGFISRARLEVMTARALDRNFMVIGVDTGFHVCSVPQAVLHGPSSLRTTAASLGSR
jgi:hypothetical protein